MNDQVTRVTRVRPAGGRVLLVRFAGDRRDHKLDMIGLIARGAHFAPLMDDTGSFAKVAIMLGDLVAPPGYCLEVLQGDLAGKHSIRINDQWRIVFRWSDEGPGEVEIVDYH